MFRHFIRIASSLAERMNEITGNSSTVDIDGRPYENTTFMSIVTQIIPKGEFLLIFKERYLSDLIGGAIIGI